MKVEEKNYTSVVDKIVSKLANIVNNFGRSFAF